MNASRRGCIFCGSTTNKMSAEHLFRQTYRNRIPHHPETERTRFVPGVPGSEHVVEMPHGIFDHKVNGVCQQCNSTWMNKIDADAEDAVVALALGGVTLRARDAAPLARWATKVALLRAWIDKSAGWEADPDLLTVFHETREPPPGTVVRVGVTDQMLKQGGANSSRGAVFLEEHEVALPADQQTPLARLRLNAVSWGIGLLYVHVILQSSGMEALDPRPSVLVGEVLGPSAVMIHPNRPWTTTFTHLVTAQVAARAGNLHHLLDGTDLHPSD